MPAFETSQPTLLAAQLLAHLGQGSDSPLTPLQYREFAAAATNAGIPLADALGLSSSEISNELGLTAEWTSKIPLLAHRGTQVAMDLERLLSLGIRALSEADADYPKAWKKTLGDGAPPLVFACGNAAVWNSDASVSVAGSRDVASAGHEFAKLVGSTATELGAVTVTGGARGVDKLALEGAMEAGGKCVAVLPADMFAVIKQADAGLVSDGRIAMLSPVHPKMRWTAGLAMARNRLIYCLSKVGVVVSSGLEEGGTWSGAREVLKNGWLPLLVMNADGSPPGNLKLIELGGVGVNAGSLSSAIQQALKGEMPANQAVRTSRARPASKSVQPTLGF